VRCKGTCHQVQLLAYILPVVPSIDEFLICLFVVRANFGVFRLLFCKSAYPKGISFRLSLPNFLRGDMPGVGAGTTGPVKPTILRIMLLLFRATCI